jgi:hypothetical protein
VQVTLAAIEALHAKLKAEIGRLARTQHKWDELVRECVILDAIVEKVRSHDVACVPRGAPADDVTWRACSVCAVQRVCVCACV